MRVKARGLIWIDGRLIVADQPRRGRRDLSLPGGRVNAQESIFKALRREVSEETGIDVEPVRLVYVSEVVESVLNRDLELIFLCDPRGVPRLRGFRSIDVQAGERLPIRPPILDLIARDAASGWQDTPRWLGSVKGRRETDE